MSFSLKCGKVLCAFFSIVSLKSTPNCIILKQIFGCNSSGDIPKNLMPHWSSRNFPWCRVGIFIIDTTTNCDEAMRTSECMIPNVRRHRLSVSDTTSGIMKNSYSSRLPNDIFEPKRRSKQQKRNNNQPATKMATTTTIRTVLTTRRTALTTKIARITKIATTTMKGWTTMTPCPKAPTPLKKHRNHRHHRKNTKSTNTIEKTTTLHRKNPQKS